jgi:hypothetical protein
MNQLSVISQSYAVHCLLFTDLHSAYQYLSPLTQLLTPLQDLRNDYAFTSLRRKEAISKSRFLVTIA